MLQGSMVVYLIESQLLEAIMLIKDSVSLVILIGVWINCLKLKSRNIDLNLQLLDLFKTLTLEFPWRIHSLIDDWDNRLQTTALNFGFKNLDESGDLYIIKI